MAQDALTKRQQNALIKVFGAGRLVDAAIRVTHNTGCSVIEIAFYEGRSDKIRMSPDGMMLGHWKHV